MKNNENGIIMIPCAGSDIRNNPSGLNKYVHIWFTFH